MTKAIWVYELHRPKEFKDAVLAAAASTGSTVGGGLVTNNLLMEWQTDMDATLMVTGADGYRVTRVRYGTVDIVRGRSVLDMGGLQVDAKEMVKIIKQLAPWRGPVKLVLDEYHQLNVFQEGDLLGFMSTKSDFPYPNVAAVIPPTWKQRIVMKRSHLETTLKGWTTNAYPMRLAIGWGNVNMTTQILTDDYSLSHVALFAVEPESDMTSDIDVLADPRYLTSALRHLPKGELVNLYFNAPNAPFQLSWGDVATTIMPRHDPIPEAITKS